MQARQARSRAIGPHVARYAINLLDGHVELVAFGIRKQQVVTLLTGRLLAHHAREERDAMRCVHHVVARLVREGDVGDIDVLGLTGTAPASRQIRDGNHRETRIGNDEAIGHVDVDDVEIAPIERFLALIGHLDEG